MRRTVFMCIELIFFCWFFLPLLLKGILNVGNFAGMCLSALAFFYTGKREYVSGLLSMLRENRGFCIAEWVVRIAAVAVCLLLAVSAVRIAAAGYKKAPDPATPVIVLGCKVKGTRPSRILQERLDAADAYLSTHPEASCVLSGGQGADEEISEASCMYAYLREKGIEENRLILEDRSVNTDQNLGYSIAKMTGSKEKVVIISNRFHVYRALGIARKKGLSHVQGLGSEVKWYTAPNMYVREAFAVMKYTICGRI